jgi:hypothetical protein
MSGLMPIEVAFRTRMETLVVVTTTVTTLSATTQGYARTTGSFITDGFSVGMEVVPTGFTQTTPGVISAVSAQRLTIAGGRTSAAAATGRSLVVGLPTTRFFENTRADTSTLTGRVYIETEILEQPAQMISATRDGWKEERGLYVVRWYGISNTGAKGLRECVDALKALFTPGTYFSTADGEAVQVRTDVTPFVSGIQQRASGHALATLTVPYRVFRRNTIAP